MQIEVPVDDAVNQLEEADKLFRAMAQLAVADDKAALHIERRRAVAVVVVRHCCGAALLQGQARLGAIQRLTLALLVHTQHQRPVRRVHVEADHVALLELLRSATIASSRDRFAGPT
jgi:hypothetical protein